MPPVGVILLAASLGLYDIYLIKHVKYQMVSKFSMDLLIR